MTNNTSKISPMNTERSLTRFDSIDSTNSEAARRISNIDKMAVFAAKYQTAGRGQRGNKWLSKAGDNLTFSIALRLGNEGMPKITPTEQFYISIITTLAICDYLRHCGINPLIKWPNDIYVKNKKICGILIENQLSGNKVSSSIIGIGLNLNQTEFAPELMNPTSIALLTSTKTTPEHALDTFLPFFIKRLDALSNAYGKSNAFKEFQQLMYRKDSSYPYRDCLSGKEFIGKIKGISAEGFLLMEMPDKSIQSFSFKEISYII